ncbi:MAG: CDP-diacylglycerol--serine O-phosphatidyltransferase, partial [Proteobacteria bacterium]|nr:CDP-diacylglycerol--serine O-phosphatidyltransferase [Pseudomonadota bacterium]
TGESLRYISLAVTLIAGLLMVSRFRYYSFKTLPFKESVPFVWILLLVMVFVLLALAPAKVLLVTSSGFAISGILFTLYRLKKKRSNKKKITQNKKEE